MSDAPALKTKYETPWTKRGNRLAVMHFEGHAILTCEAEAMFLGKGHRSVFSLGRIVVLDFQVRSETERFVAHCFAFYNDEELSQHALDAIRKIAASLNEPPETPPGEPSVPPRGVVN
jgi:hypothetical protein